MENRYLKDSNTPQNRAQIGLSIQSDEPTHPKIPTGSNPKTGRPDQVTGRRQVICSKNRLRRVGLGFPPKTQKKPDPTDVLRISSKKFQNPAEISRIRRDFPESDAIFQIPARFSRFRPQISRFRVQIFRFWQQIFIFRRLIKQIQ